MGQKGNRTSFLIIKADAVKLRFAILRGNKIKGKPGK